MDVEIKYCDDKFLLDHADDFSSLCRRSFAEHLEKNINMMPCTISSDKWVEISEGCTGLYIESNDGLIAVWLVSLNYLTKEAYGKILAVDPEYKGKHIGTVISQALLNYLKEKNMNVFYTDTSLKAPHLIKFHKSYGCKGIGMTSWPNTNYYTVILRAALKNEYEISDKEAKRMFIKSKIKCLLLFRENGKSTLLARLIRFIRCR